MAMNKEYGPGEIPFVENPEDDTFEYRDDDDFGVITDTDIPLRPQTPVEESVNLSMSDSGQSSDENV